ncbi:hypothetical protein BH23CHL2_BH23CHL2_27400 [soil metagenome]
MSYALGIDLGTTFSAAAVARNGQAEILSLGYRSPTLPSVIVARESGEILIGEAAERRALVEPLRTAREFKRRLGDPTPLILGSAPYGAETLMSYLLRGVFDLVVEQQGEAPGKLVISHPANWGLYKLDLLEQAVRMADVGSALYISEPIAAALHYAGRERIETGKVVAVYDFGGGTFDAALLRRTETSFEQLGDPEGIERLGGIDFDEAVFGHVMQSISDLVEDLDPSDTTAMAAVARLRDECRQAKEVLSVDTDVIIPVILPNVQTEVRLTRSEFEEMVEPRIGATIAALRRAVRSADMDLADVDRILLVGGSSRIPLVRQQVREETDSEIFLDAHPKYAIALGAAIAADLNLGTSTAAQMRSQAQLASPPASPTPVVEPQRTAPEPERVAPADTAPSAPAPPPAAETPDPEPDSALDRSLGVLDEDRPAAKQQDAGEPVRDAPTEQKDDVVGPEGFDPRGATLVDLKPADFPAPPTEPRQAVPEPWDVEAETGEFDAPTPADEVASSQWRDGISLSPVLIAALAAVALGSAAGTFLLLSLVVG